MATTEQTVSTWGADIVRGLAHPNSVAARKSRIRAATAEQQLRVEKFSRACSLIRESLRNSEQLADLLYCISETLADRDNGAGIDRENISLVDGIADVVQYRTSLEVETLIDAAKGITTVEVEL